MINTWIGTGRLVRSPELRYTNSGTEVCNMTIACERSFKNKQGKREVDYIDVTTWRKLAENCAHHLEKGRLVGIRGSLQIDKSKKDGRTYINPKIVAEEVQFLDWGNDNSSSSNSDSKSNNYNNDNLDDDIDMDNIPF